MRAFRIQLQKKLPTLDELNEMELSSIKFEAARIALLKPRFRSRGRRRCLKGDVTRYDSQRRFLAQHRVTTLLLQLFQMAAILSQHCESSRVMSP